MLTVPTAVELQSCVSAFWASGPEPFSFARERVLPSGVMHLAIRLDGSGVRLYDDETDANGRLIAHAVVAGTRDRCYLKDVRESSRSVGAVLRPGAARLLFGCGADALANRHVALSDLVGDAAIGLQQALAASTSPVRQIALLQAFLRSRLRPVRGLHPQVAAALAGLANGDRVATLAEVSGCSHKRFIALFRDATGLAPKCYARVQRLQRALAIGATSNWSDTALAAGYSDQAHLNREFRAMTGTTPQAWRAVAVTSSHHVRADNFVKDAARDQP
jgi:AraC-like DNA-binding protein